VIPLFALPPEVGNVICTTNAVENSNSQLRQIIKTRGHFRNDDAATKRIWLVLRNITVDRGRPSHEGLESRNESDCYPVDGSITNVRATINPP
jgi:transposase-like protein